MENSQAQDLSKAANDNSNSAGAGMVSDSDSEDIAPVAPPRRHRAAGAAGAGGGGGSSSSPTAAKGQSASADSKLAEDSGNGSDSDSDSDAPLPPPRARQSPKKQSEVAEARRRSRRCTDLAVAETLKNEKAWREKLAVIVDELLPAFRRYAENPEVPCEGSLPDLLFGGFVSIRNLHDSLWTGYEKALAAMGYEGDTPLPAETGAGRQAPVPVVGLSERRATALAEQLVHTAPYFKLYIDFIRDQQKADRNRGLCEECMASIPGFKQALSEMLESVGLKKKTDCLKLTLDSLFDAPRARLMRIPMPLKELLQFLPTDENDASDSSQIVLLGLKARAAVSKAIDSLQEIILAVNHAQKKVDQAWLGCLLRYSSTRPSNFELVERHREIVSHHACTVQHFSQPQKGGGDSGDVSVPGANRTWPCEATLTLCNDCVILTAPLDFGRASIEILHVFRDVYKLSLEAQPASREGGARVVVKITDKASMFDVCVEVSVTSEDFKAIEEFKFNLPGGRAKPRFPELQLVSNKSLAGDHLSQLRMPMEVAWFSIACVVALVLQYRFPDVK